MIRMMDTEPMLEVCRLYAAQAPECVVVREPYIPYIPENWNGLLALAESQNIDKKYKQFLDGMSPEERFQRLGKRDRRIDIQPWDDDSIKLMLKSTAPTISIDRIAVSNGVPWSLREDGRNVNPDKTAKSLAAEFWKGIFELISHDLKRIVTFGKVAAEVVKAANVEFPTLNLRLPSPRARYPIHGLFDIEELLCRYEEVREAAVSLGIDLNGKKNKGLALFACHAASLAKGRFAEFT